jgi:hypothetical protein
MQRKIADPATYQKMMYPMIRSCGLCAMTLG